MRQFLSRFADSVSGVISGFDRLVFRGTLMPLVMDGGMFTFLCRSGVRLLDFKDFVERTSQQVKEAALAEAKRLERPVVYLGSSSTSKEDVARDLLAKHPVDQGLVCVLSAVEPCMSFEYQRSSDHTERGLKLRPRKCLHLYQYRIHPRFGFMGARIQTWFPFNMQITLNGREWLSRQLTSAGLDFIRAGNCFPSLTDIRGAQRLLDRQLKTNWPFALGRIARALNPCHSTIFATWPMDYYWSAYQTEWATDVMFNNSAALDAVYPSLVRHATHHFHSPDVMRFLGHKGAEIHGNFTGEVVSSYKRRLEGVRVKHWVRGNSVKMYNKAGSILRIETTLAKTNDFKVLRPPHDDPNGDLAYRPLRKGVADLHRRAQISQQSNQRYLDALSQIANDTPCAKIFDTVSRPVIEGKSRFRALRIGDQQEVSLLSAIARGEFNTAGFRNRDLLAILTPTKTSHGVTPNPRQQSARIGRLIRLLRAHRLIKKVPKSHRYLLTERGRQITAAIFATREALISKLLAA